MNKLAAIVDETSLVKFQKQDEFLEFINQQPPSVIVKDHPMVSNVKYIPIDKVELMLDKIFQVWSVEILNSGQLLNSITVTVRLHYRHPITGEMEHQDGIGAMAIQVDKGKNASQLEWIKSDAIMKGLPAAKSFAIKDAAEHIGNIFGRNLNRKDTVAFTSSYKTDGYEQKIAEAKTSDDLNTILKSMDSNAKKAYTNMLGEKKRELQNAKAV